MPLDPHDLGHVERLWPVLDGCQGRLVNHSENHTFLFEGQGTRYVLRVHRPGYQDGRTIQSELSWLAALHRDTNLPVPVPLVGLDGEFLQTIKTRESETRNAVLFEFIPGAEPRIEQDLIPLFSQLGSFAAQLHSHAINWHRPHQFQRQAWTGPSILEADGLWGNWRVAPGVNKANRPIIAAATEVLQRDLSRYGMGADRYGLIHADMRLGNLLINNGALSLIDFDDCGFCWFTYDFAASISFYENHPSVPDLQAAWLETYQRVRPLDQADIASIQSMILLRRMALLAWIGTHADTPLAQQFMPGFADGTAALAERYLAR